VAHVPAVRLRGKPVPKRYRRGAHKAALNKVRIAGLLSDGTPIFFPGDAEFNRQRLISDSFHI
jgi:hypothetical protein